MAVTFHIPLSANELSGAWYIPFSFAKNIQLQRQVSVLH